MILVADESVDGPIVERLRQEGHDVVYVAELSPGITDDEVLETANDRGAPLLTADNDFGDLVYRLGRAHAGVVLLRVGGLSGPTKADLVAELLRLHEPEIAGAFTVVAPTGVRIRRRP